MQDRPDASLDLSEVYLFECHQEPLFAVSCDRTGANIPTRSCPEGWHFLRTFGLAGRAPLPLTIDPEPVQRGLECAGYYIWREGY